MDAIDPSPCRAALICLLLGWLGAIPLVVLTPPLQVADEFQHFARAYQLSEGRLWSRARDGEVGDDLPASLAAFARRFLGSTLEHSDRALTAQPLRATLAEQARPLLPDDRQFLSFRGAAFYSPLPYVPQVLAIEAARLFGAGPLMLLYAGRLANALAAVGLLAASVRIVPFGRKLVMVAGLLPMALYQDASLSPDSMIIACAFLYTSLAARAQARGRWSIGAIVAAIVAGAVFCSVKPVYAPLLFVGLVPDVFRRDRARPWLVVYGLIVGAVGAVTLSWMRATFATALAPVRAGVDAHAQAAFVGAHPIDYARVMASTLVANAAFYYRSMIGQFGWLTIRPPPLLLILPPIAAVVAVVDRRDGAQVPTAAALWQLLLAAACVPLIMTSLYLIWTPVAAPTVEGVQGRYVLPMLAAVALACSRSGHAATRRVASPSATLATLLVALVVVQIAITDLTIASAFAVF